FFAISSNQLWADLAVLAMNLVAWMSLAALPAGHEAGTWDMKRWRFRLFSIAGKIVSSGRQKRLLIPEDAPESPLLVALQEGTARLRERWRQGHLAA
ncbi:transposase, partial [Paeniglutamicibacter gangotriensis]|uniref:transposase n=1 Tax=Paeniglutamicibacter gangotriensis TaxID=254787 RepID=UPI0037C5E968